MTEYYYLTSTLPPLEIGHIPPLNFLEFKEILKINLKKEDLEQVHTLLSFIDMQNLRSLWAHEPHDPRGNYTRPELIQALVDKAWPTEGEEEREFPDYLREFLEKYHDDQERNAHFAFLITHFLKEEGEKNTGFLRAYFNFEREMRLVMVGFRAKRLHRDLARELQFEDPTEPVVAEILAQRDAPIFEPPFEYKELKPLFLSFAEFPVELHKALLAYSFAAVQEIYSGEIFTLDRILGFMVRLLMVERWLELDTYEGIKLLDAIEGKIQ